MYSCGLLHMDQQGKGNQLVHLYNSPVMIQDEEWKTCQERWTIGTSGDRESEKSVLAARHNDDIQ